MEAEQDPFEPDGLTTKILNFICCHNETCKACWETCIGENKKRLRKEDIRHVINQQPKPRLDSTASQSSSASVFFSQTSNLNSPVCRDRVESDASSRKESESSASESTSISTKRVSPRPVIDMRPIEFWAANRETVQPRTPRLRLPSESEISIDELQPDLYDSSDSSDDCLTDEQKLIKFKLGQVHFSLQYDIPCKCLVVRIIEAKDLPLPCMQEANKQDMAHSNPYAKVCLIPDTRDSRQTTVQRKTQNPTWGEIFKFPMQFSELQKRTLEITVKDFDKFSRHCIIGQVTMGMDGMNLVKGGHMWKPLVPSSKDDADLGELLLSLNFLPGARRLNVDILKCKQLLQTDMVGGSDPFIKVTLYTGEKVSKTKRTSTKRNTIDPVYNESMSFNISAEELKECSLLVSVWDYNCKSKDDFVGRVVLGKQSTGTEETTHWNRMLQCHRSPVVQWHILRSRQECDRASPISCAIP